MYLDETEAYAEAGNITIGPSFTIACWIKLMPSAPYYRAIVTSSTGLQMSLFVFGVNSGNQLQFENWVSDVKYTYTTGSLGEKQWFHVAVSFVVDDELFFFINGYKLSPTGSSGFLWETSVSLSLFEIGRFFDQTDSKYRYFHGFISDLFIFDRALSADDIGKLTGKNKSSSCTSLLNIF